MVGRRSNRRRSIGRSVVGQRAGRVEGGRDYGPGVTEQKRWRDFTPAQKATIVAAGAVEVVLTTVALVDLVRRPSAQVRGPKLVWVAGCAVQPVGPVAYLVLGRRRA